MIQHLVSVSVVISAVLLVRAVFRDRVPNRLIYALWAVVFLRLAFAGTLFDITLPAIEAPIQDVGYESDIMSEPLYESPSDKLPVGTVTPDDSDQSVSQSPTTIPTAPVQKPDTLPSQTVRPNDDLPPDEGDAVVNIQSSDAAVQKTPVSAKTVLIYVYAFGLIAVLTYFALSELAVWRALRRSRRFLFKDGKVNVYVSDASVSPCTFGIRPSVYLTSKIAETPDMRLVLLHEKTHIRHLDSLRALLRRLAAAVYWFHPLVWIYIVFANRDAELACDEAVSAGLDENQRLEYARMIFDHAPRARGAVASFGGKPMKKRIVSITKTNSYRLISIIISIILTLSLCLFGFVGCVREENPADESGDNSQPDQTLENGDWPCELFPEDFPVPDYTEIYSVKTTDDSVTAVLFAEWDMQSPPVSRLCTELEQQGYFNYANDITGEDKALVSKYGYAVLLDMVVPDAKHDGSALAVINENSPTGHTYSVTVKKIDIPPAALFFDYPAPDTQLGCDDFKFSLWPSYYLPDEFPQPDVDSRVETVDMYQDTTGVHLTFIGTAEVLNDYLKYVVDRGRFIPNAKQPYMNKNGDYLYVEMQPFDTSDPVTATEWLLKIQACLYNEAVRIPADEVSLYTSFVNRIIPADENGTQVFAPEASDTDAVHHIKNYAFYDLNGDGCKELITKGERYIYNTVNVYSVKDGAVFLVYRQEAGFPVTSILENGAIFARRSSTGTFYEYTVINEKCQPETVSLATMGDDYFIGDEKMTRAEWDERTEEYFKYEPVELEWFDNVAEEPWKPTPIPITDEQIVNEDYVRSVEGGMDFTYDELVSMSSAELYEKVISRAYEQLERFSGLGYSITGYKMVVFENETYPYVSHASKVSKDDMTYAEFVKQTRRYFDADFSVSLFEQGFYFEYDGYLYVVGTARGGNLSYYSTEYEIISADEDEIVIRALSAYVTNEYFNDWYGSQAVTIPEEGLEYQEQQYVLTRQDNGRWAFSQFELPY